MNFLRRFQEKYQVKLTEEILSLYRILGNLDYQCFFFRVDKESDYYLILRGKYINNGQLVKIQFSDFLSEKKLIEIYEEKINHFLDNNSCCFPFAICEQKLVGLLFTNGTAEGFYLFDLKQGKQLNFLTDKIEGVFFNRLRFQVDFAIYLEQNIEVLKKRNIKISSVVNYPELFVFLYPLDANDKISYKEVLSTDSFILTDSEGFVSIDDYVRLIEQLNHILHGVKILVDSTLPFNPLKEIRISTNELEEYLNKGDYLNFDFIQLLNTEIKIITKGIKKLILFRELNFGQEIGIAYLTNEALTALSDLNLIQVFNYRVKAFV